MRAILSSPRRRRRLGWTVGLVLVAVAAVVVGVRYTNTADQLADTPIVSDTTGSAPAPAAIRVTPAVRREVDRTVQLFVRTAVIRRDLERAWPLASPVMREGVTHEDWRRGDIPVQPFPAEALAGAGWRLRFRDGRTLVLDVMVQPKPGSGAPVAVYAVDLSAPGTGPPRRFLVDAWVPQATLGAAAGPAEPGAGTGPESEAAANVFDEGRLGAEWLLVPAAIVLLLLVTLGGFGVRSVVRARRAERAYRERFR